jgi:hypothetical protein
MMPLAKIPSIKAELGDGALTLNATPAIAEENPANVDKEG